MQAEHLRKPMSSENSSADDAAVPINQTPIPSLLTNSAAEVLAAFGESIVEIEAEASIDTWNRRELMRDHGLMHEQLNRDKLTLNYHKITDADGMPENPLTETQIDMVMAQVDRHLDGELAGNVDPDMAVSKLELRVTSDEIMHATRATTNEFELVFVSDPAGEARDVTQEKNYHKGLYDEMGFDYRNLNLRSVYETRAKYAQQSDGKLMGWGGPSDTRPRCDESLAQAVNDVVLPDEYGALKWYIVTEDNVTKLQSVDAGGEAE